MAVLATGDLGYTRPRLAVPLESQPDYDQRLGELGRANHLGFGENPGRLGGKAGRVDNCGGSVLDCRSAHMRVGCLIAAGFIPRSYNGSMPLKREKVGGGFDAASR